MAGPPLPLSLADQENVSTTPSHAPRCAKRRGSDKPSDSLAARVTTETPPIIASVNSGISSLGRHLCSSGGFPSFSREPLPPLSMVAPTLLMTPGCIPTASVSNVACLEKRPLTLLERRSREKNGMSTSCLSGLSMDTIKETNIRELASATGSPPVPQFRGWSTTVQSTADRREASFASQVTSPLDGKRKGSSFRQSVYPLGAVKVVSYNILASHLVTTDRYPNCPPAALGEDYRIWIIKEEIRQAKPDILLLQEISVDVFERPQSLGDYLRTSLNYAGDHVVITDQQGKPRCRSAASVNLGVSERDAPLELANSPTPRSGRFARRDRTSVSPRTLVAREDPQNIPGAIDASAVPSTPCNSTAAQGCPLPAPFIDSEQRRTEMDGVSIFYLKERFELLETVPLYFNQLASQDSRLSSYELKKLSATSHNVALVFVLRDLLVPHHIYIVAAVHLIWQRVEAQLWQSWHLMRVLEGLKAKYSSLSVSGRCTPHMKRRPVGGDSATCVGVSALESDCDPDSTKPFGCSLPSLVDSDVSPEVYHVTCIVGGDFNADRSNPAFHYICEGTVPAGSPVFDYWNMESLARLSLPEKPETPSERSVEDKVRASAAEPYFTVCSKNSASLHDYQRDSADDNLPLVAHPHSAPACTASLASMPGHVLVPVQLHSLSLDVGTLSRDGFQDEVLQSPGSSGGCNERSRNAGPGFRMVGCPLFDDRDSNSVADETSSFTRNYHPRSQCDEGIATDSIDNDGCQHQHDSERPLSALGGSICSHRDTHAHRSFSAGKTDMLEPSLGESSSQGSALTNTMDERDGTSDMPHLVPFASADCKPPQYGHNGSDELHSVTVPVTHSSDCPEEGPTACLTRRVPGTSTKGPTSPPTGSCSRSRMSRASASEIGHHLPPPRISVPDLTEHEPLEVGPRAPRSLGAKYAMPSVSFVEHSLRLRDSYATYCERHPLKVSAVNPSTNAEGKVLDHILFEGDDVECTAVIRLADCIDLPTKCIPSDHYMVGAILVPGSCADRSTATNS